MVSSPSESITRPSSSNISLMIDPLVAVTSTVSSRKSNCNLPSVLPLTLSSTLSMLDEAKKAGANVIVPEVDGVVNPATRQMPLSLIVNPAPTLQLSREEIFGPILPIISYSTLEKAVEHVNNDERPLALYVFGEGDEVDFVIKNTKSGGTAVNSCALQAALPSLGFGGIGNSGMFVPSLLPPISFDH